MTRATEPSAVEQPIDVGIRVERRERRPIGGVGAEAAHQRLRAVVAGADADALAAEDLADVVGVHAVEHERDQPATVAGVGRSVDRQPRDLGQSAPARRRDSDCSWARIWSIPSACDPVDGRAEPDRLGDLRGAGLELPGQIGPGRLGVADRLDHVTAAHERRHRLQQLAPAVQDPDAGRPVDLVAGPGVEVGVDRPQVDGQLRHRLSAVDHDDRAGRVRAARDLGDRVDRAEHVGDVGDADQLGLPRQQCSPANPGPAARRRAPGHTRAPRRPRCTGSATGRCWSGARAR